MSTQNLFTKRTFTFIFTVACVPLLCLITILPTYAQTKGTTKVPFKKDRFNRIFLPAKIDQDTVSLLFGTYSKTLRLTPYFLETQSLYPGWGRLTTIDTKGKRHSKTLFYLPKLQIGSVKFRNEEAVVNQAFPDSVATGSIGTLMVYQYNWKIDNDRNEMTISKAPFAAERTFTTISYKNNNYPTAVVNIGNINSEFVLDLGSGAGFQVSSRTTLGRSIIEDLNLEPTRVVTSNIHTSKSVDTIYEVVVPSLVFNGITLKDQKVTISSEAPHNTIGTGFLGNYNVILNNSKKRKVESAIILEKRLVD